MKTKPLFPQTTKCPECNKSRRVNWRAAGPVPAYLTGIGVFPCLGCGTINTWAVGTADAIERYKMEVFLPGFMMSSANPDTHMAGSFETIDYEGGVIWRIRREALRAHMREMNTVTNDDEIT